MRMLLTVLMTFAIATGSPIVAGAQAATCQTFPSSWSLNQRVDRLPVLKRSDAIVHNMGYDDPVGPGFSDKAGLPYTEVTPSTPRTAVDFFWDKDSDQVGYPLGGPLKIQTDVDRHAILVDRTSCKLYEIFDLQRKASRWTAGSGVAWDMRSTDTRPEGLTSADAAGLPIFPLLVRKAEVDTGVIRHAIRITTERSRRAFVYPATHFASDSDDPDLPRMGERLRLKSSASLRGLAPEARVIARAMKRYGVVVADNGINWSIAGAPDPGWDNPRLETLMKFKGKDFEVVDTSRRDAAAARRR